MATTLTIDEAKRKQLERYRHPDHESWSEVLEAMMHVLPDAEQMQDEGCCGCGKHSDKDAPIDQYGGVTQFFHAGVPDRDDEYIYHSNYFCSRECAAELDEEINHQFPESPDYVHIGGHAEPQYSVEGATYILDGDIEEITVSVPGAFCGSEYDHDYLGEPVFIEDEGEIVQVREIADIQEWKDGTSFRLTYESDDVRESCHPYNGDPLVP